MKSAASGVGVLGLAGWLRRVGEGRRRLKPSQEARLARAVVEVLESRRMLACNFTSGILTMTGTSGADTIKVYRIIDAGTGEDRTHVRRVILPTPENCSALTSSVTRIDVSGLGDADIILVETQAEIDGLTALGTNPVSKPSSLLGGDGNDQITGGDPNDTINGGAGDDTNVNGRGGNDLIYGGYGGADVLDGGSGTDTLYGGDNQLGGYEEHTNDVLRGGDGTDYLYGEGGNDSLFGEAGSDGMYGGSGADEFWAEDDTFDYVDGGDGSDTVHDSDGQDTLLNI